MLNIRNLLIPICILFFSIGIKGNSKYIGRAFVLQLDESGYSPYYCQKMYFFWYPNPRRVSATYLKYSKYKIRTTLVNYVTLAKNIISID